MSIWLTGDTHADWMSRLSTSNFPKQKELTKEDYVIILGDFGIWDNSPREIFNLNWLEKKPFTTLFISGNHENYDILDSFPVSSWKGGLVNFLRPSVIHLRRGECFTLEGLKFFTFGGAQSHDIQDGILEIGDPRIQEWKKNYRKLFRINHVSWWERELPSKEEMEYGMNTLLKNKQQVDFILTHCPPTSILPQIGYWQETDCIDCLSSYLETIKNQVNYRYWYFGHIHQERVFPHEKCYSLYEKIIQVN